MVRKINIFIISCCLLLCATCGTVAAADYTTYDGNISTSMLTYFKDILSNVSINDHYILFRSGQYQYDLVVAEDIVYDSGLFTVVGQGKHYVIDTNNNIYNSYYSYSVNEVNNISIAVKNKIVYSDIGDFPQLEERGSRYEVLQTILLFVLLLSGVIRSIFFISKRR